MLLGSSRNGPRLLVRDSRSQLRSKNFNSKKSNGSGYTSAIIKTAANTISNVKNSKGVNKTYEALLRLNVTRRGISGIGPTTDMKHIPDIFKLNSRQICLKLLAGLIDTDGSYHRKGDCFWLIKSASCHGALFNDIALLARLLGFHVTSAFAC